MSGELELPPLSLEKIKNMTFKNLDAILDKYFSGLNFDSSDSKSRLRKDPKICRYYVWIALGRPILYFTGKSHQNRPLEKFRDLYEKRKPALARAFENLPDVEKFIEEIQSINKLFEQDIENLKFEHRKFEEHRNTIAEILQSGELSGEEISFVIKKKDAWLIDLLYQILEVNNITESEEKEKSRFRVKQESRDHFFEVCKKISDKLLEGRLSYKNLDVSLLE